MNTRQLKYAVMLANKRSFSQVAEELGISQPALSKQILNLEKELGVRLFDRNCIPLELTPGGKYFIEQAGELLYREDQMMRTMQKYKQGEAGEITIGITPFRSSYLIPPVIRRVRQRFPEIQVCLREAGSDILRQEAAEGKYDFAVVNLPVDESVLECVALEPDRLVLAVPAQMAELLPQGTQQREIDFRDCSALPFVVVGQGQEMRRLFQRLCASAEFTPVIATEVVGLTTAWAMARSGVGAAVLPLQYIREESQNDGLIIVEIRGVTYSRQPVIVTKRGQYISPAARYAMELLTQQGKTVI